MLDNVTSLYVLAGHIPESYELVFCTETTPFEVIQSLLLRCILPTTHNASLHPVYCLVNVQLLPQKVQIQALHFIKHRLLDIEEKPKFSLVIIGHEGILMSSLQQFVINNWMTLPSDQLTEVKMKIKFALFLFFQG